jgi:carbamate kinase
MNNKLIYIEEYQQNIPLFLKHNRTGFVHSVFENGINIRMGERLIFIGTVKNGRLPFGMHLQKETLKELTASIHRSLVVSWNEESKRLIFKNTCLAVSLECGVPFQNIVNPSSPSSTFPQSIQTFVQVLLNYDEGTGLDLDIEQFVLHYLENRQQENPIAMQVCRLMDVIYSNDSDEAEKILRYFLGRGKGLTPSGDDHLVGLLSIQSISNPFNSVFLGTLKQILEQEKVTTDIGNEYLLYALNGEFSSSIVNLLNAINANDAREVENHLLHLLTMGHSSGLDTAFGMLIGLLSILNRRKQIMAERVVIALGGNAILQPNQEATYENQLENVRKCSEIIARIVKNGHRVIITHGNGPQVGNILRQNEEAKDVVPPFPLDVCSAESQGFIGYMMEQTLKNELRKLNLHHPVVSLLTQTEVDKDDPAFENPTKPIGVFFTEEEAKALAEEKNWVVMEDAGRGWRRAVASPMPKSILGSDIVKKLTDEQGIVIAAGGGGIPVVTNEDGTLSGIEAVIDKDRSAFRLAQEVEAEVFMVLTDVQNVYVNYGTPNQRALTDVTLKEANQYVKEGQFSAGSMGPKMEAAMKFAEQGGRAIICSLDQADLALEGKAGTHITKCGLPQALLA